MQVEVTAANIVKFGLVQLTGNSVETMLTLAREAADTGHILTVEIPDDQLVHMNVFDVAESRQVVDEDELEYQNRIMDPEPHKSAPTRVVEVHVVENPEGDIVDGEIVEDDNDE